MIHKTFHWPCSRSQKCLLSSDNQFILEYLNFPNEKEPSNDLQGNLIILSFRKKSADRILIRLSQLKNNPYIKGREEESIELCSIVFIALFMHPIGENMSLKREKWDTSGKIAEFLTDAFLFFSSPWCGDRIIFHFPSSEMAMKKFTGLTFPRLEFGIWKRWKFRLRFRFQMNLSTCFRIMGYDINSRNCLAFIRFWKWQNRFGNKC